MKKFLIVSLPRSRSAWLSQFLSVRGKRCAHDLIVGCSSIGDFDRALEGVDGSCETGAMMGWKLLLQRRLRLIVIKRPVEEVALSLENATGFPANRALLEERYAMLDALSRASGVKTFSFSQLREEAVCREIFEDCLGFEPPEGWWEEMSGLNVQINMAQRIEDLVAAGPRLALFTQEVLAASQKIEGVRCLN